MFLRSTLVFNKILGKASLFKAVKQKKHIAARRGGFCLIVPPPQGITERQRGNPGRVSIVIFKLCGVCVVPLIFSLPSASFTKQSFTPKGASIYFKLILYFLVEQFSFK
jgi:hypothetical protein